MCVCVCVCEEVSEDVLLYIYIYIGLCICMYLQVYDSYIIENGVRLINILFNIPFPYKGTNVMI